ncbi:Mucin-21 [Manis pentadactyla]|nr:Mucin-21 [Manis pentadactyla]
MEKRQDKRNLKRETWESLWEEHSVVRPYPKTYGPATGDVPPLALGAAHNHVSNCRGVHYRVFKCTKENIDHFNSTYWNHGYGYQQGYGPGYGGSDNSPHGYYSYSPGYYYSSRRHRDSLVVRATHAVRLERLQVAFAQHRPNAFSSPSQLNVRITDLFF